MRESIGTTFLLNFIVIFIVFIMAFLAATLSYYKAYRVNNAILHSIEKYEGFNAKSKKEAEEKLKNLGYEIADIKCPDRFKSGSSDDATPGKLISKNSDGYCVYLYFNENAPLTTEGKKSTTNIYYSLGVATYMRLNIPVIGGLIKIPVFSKTYNIYYFREWGVNEDSIENLILEQVDK